MIADAYGAIPLATTSSEHRGARGVSGAAQRHAPPFASTDTKVSSIPTCNWLARSAIGIWANVGMTPGRRTVPFRGRRLADDPASRRLAYTPKGAVRIGLPTDDVDRLFPKLFYEV
jgi:hypothetical protein